MSEARSRFMRAPRSLRLLLAGLGVCLTGFLVYAGTWGTSLWRRPDATGSATSADPYAAKAVPEASHEQVVAVCGACHPYPPPETFARYDWPEEVSRGFAFLEQSERRKTLQPPPVVEVIRYYTNRAPMVLPEPDRLPLADTNRFRFRSTGYRGEGPDPPVFSDVRFAHLFDNNDRHLDVVACDMAGGRVFGFRPYEPNARPIVLADGMKDPCRTEVVDLDQDGVQDVLVAVIGNRWPTDDRTGGVVWLRGNRSGGFTRFTLAEGLGRTDDAQAADFDGDGDLDVVVAVFGYLNVGEILLLENRTTNPDQPHFVSRQIDARHGAIHVPVTDLNHDGHPDFVALLAQEHEVVEAFLGDGKGQFTRQTIYAGPHPAFSSSGIALVDMDGDGDLDVLMTNGDAMDRMYFKPYHGIQWLENQGSYPYVAHQVDFLYGVSRALARDLDGDGDLDILATVFLPGGYWDRQRTTRELESIVVYEQTQPGKFVRQTLEKVTSNHPSCDIGDYDGDGRLDFVTTNCFFTDEQHQALPTGADWIVLYRGEAPLSSSSAAAK